MIIFIEITSKIIPPCSTASELASSASSLSVSMRKCFPGMRIPNENSRGSISMTPLRDIIAETENTKYQWREHAPFKVKLTHILSAILCHDLISILFIVKKYQLSNNHLSL